MEEIIRDGSDGKSRGVPDGGARGTLDMTTRQSGERRGDLFRRSRHTPGQGTKKARASRLTGSQVDGFPLSREGHPLRLYLHLESVHVILILL